MKRLGTSHDPLHFQNYIPLEISRKLHGTQFGLEGRVALRSLLLRHFHHKQMCRVLNPLVPVAEKLFLSHVTSGAGWGPAERVLVPRRGPGGSGKWLECCLSEPLDMVHPGPDNRLICIGCRRLPRPQQGTAPGKDQLGRGGPATQRVRDRRSKEPSLLTRKGSLRGRIAALGQHRPGVGGES